MCFSHKTGNMVLRASINREAQPRLTSGPAPRTDASLDKAAVLSRKYHHHGFATTVDLHTVCP